MALIIEDGTGVENADAFISADEFAFYAEQVNNDITSYSAAQIDGAIVTASLYFISVNYDYKGEKLNKDQGLAIPTDIVPLNSDIKRATYLAAILSLQGRLFVDATSIGKDGSIKLDRKKLNGLEKEQEFYEGTNYTSKYPTTQIDRMLQAYIDGGTGYAPTRALRY